MNSIDIMRIATRLFYIFPIKKNRVVLTAYNGRQYGCSPKYITEELIKEKRSYDIYYALTDGVDIELPKNVKKLRYRSLKHFYLLMTAKFIILNSTGFSCMLPYRKKQVFINTWHGGGAFKKTGISSFMSKEDLKKRKISGNNTTYFISSSRVFGENQQYSMCLSKDKMLNIGTPRNDIMFKDGAEIRQKVHDYFKVDLSYGLILYAPTYRDNKRKAVSEYSFDAIDVQMILEAAKERFGKEFKFLYRAHHDMMPENLADNCFNATSYEDMQELLVATDILITDYSSSIWDYSLTKKAGFLYTPDKKEYEDSNILASPVETWPFKFAESNEVLASMIRSFDQEEHESRINEYYNRLESYEAGDATKQLVQIMRSLIGQ